MTDDASRPRRNTRPRDALGRPLPYGSTGVDGPPEGVVRTPVETLAEADRLLRAGQPFHAHEVLEDAWKSCPEDERGYWQGLAQLAVGVTHAARGNAVGAVRLLERGAANVSASRHASSHGVDVDALLTWVADSTRRIGDAGPVLLAPPPLTSSGGGHDGVGRTDEHRQH